MAAKERLDVLLTARGLCPSRERAKTTVMSGLVYVDGRKEDKPGLPVLPDAVIEVRGDPVGFVSRGGLKLQKALDAFGIAVVGLSALDAGASTGGFTDCLLGRGARHVWAVDVGYGQLDWKLRQDPRVTVMERTNIRYVTPEKIGVPLDLAVMDLSFISLRLVLPAVAPLLTDSGLAVCLVKPQFEAGRGKVGKKGVVRDPAVHMEVLERFLGDARQAGYRPVGLTHSPIRGPEGNIEYLAHLTRTAGADAALDVRLAVEQAHGSFDRGSESE
ncbi:MAG: TlyA family RNA methyltransferase [Oscillospiraceae bacterium]|jgi:23S rRNA (cytidine1920-2'-O)/16S rRNA (cytidine1409-2'-O)-methyltransferase|nr:TlyA family RNA methyltransferase [Oscillospiraceae bacterium]